MTPTVGQVSGDPFRERLYETYASRRSGHLDKNTIALIYRRDIRPLLPSPAYGPVVDIGCGQGELVRLLVADAYDSEGFDVGPEQVALAHEAGIHQVRRGDYREILDARAGELAAITAIGLPEHPTKDEVPSAFDRSGRIRCRHSEVLLPSCSWLSERYPR